jgi:hypothetical protein
MSPVRISIEPLVPPSELPVGRGTLSVGLLADPVPLEAEAPDLIKPIVGFRSWRILRDGPAQGELSSPNFPVSWSEPVLRAECRRFRSTEDLLREPHRAPEPVCGCGICARHAPTSDFSKVDFRGVSGIVTVWGRIDVNREGLRAEYARVEALALYSRWTRHQRQAVSEVAGELGVDLVDLHELGVVARSYGEVLPASLLSDERPRSVRDRFAALFKSRVGE